MKMITCVVLLTLLFYILLKKRKIDFFTIGALSILIYYFPVFIGQLKSSYSNRIILIDDKSYMCVAIFALIYLIFLLFTDKYSLKNVTITKNINDKVEKYKAIKNDNLSNFCVLLLSLIGLCMMMYTFIKTNGLTDTFNKMQLLTATDRITEYMKYIGTFTFVYSFCFKGKYINFCRINSLIIILYTFLLGHRSFIVIGLISIFINYLGSNSSIRLIDLIKKKKMVLLSVFVVFFFFIFIKGVFAALMNGDFELVSSRLTNQEYYINTLLTSEPNSIMLNLNNVVSYNLTYGFDNYIFGTLSLIPLLGDVFISNFNYVTFERVLNLTFNKQLDLGIGLGCTFIGEAYAVGNIFYLIIITILTLLLIKNFIKKREKTNNPYTYVFLSIVLSYFTFYIHRNSLLFMLITIRAYIYILILLIILKGLFKRTLSK